jgi:hypothetical protein
MRGVSSLSSSRPELVRYRQRFRIGPPRENSHVHDALSQSVRPTPVPALYTPVAMGNFTSAAKFELIGALSFTSGGFDRTLEGVTNCEV